MVVDLRYRFKRNVIVFESDDSTSESSEEEFSKISYEELYGSLQLGTSLGSSRDADNSVSSSFVPESPMTCVNPPVCSTPLRNEEPFCLKIFEEQIDENDNDEKDFADESFENAEIELFDGSDFSSNDFFKKFKEIANQYNLQNVARKDLLKLFSSFLPSPNNLRAPIQKEHLPSTTVFKDGDSTFVAIQLLPQLKKILSQNSEFIKKSWQSDCKWSFGKTAMKKNEIYLNVNIDGVALFKSRNFSLWPVWVEVFNLPEKIRSKFSNHALIGIWHGKSKPNWSFLLKKIAIEMELFLNLTVFVNDVGYCVFKFLFLVCDMPAMASVCLVQQFNGYFGCPYCYSRGVHKNKRMLYLVDEKVVERENSDYVRNAELNI